MTWFWERIWSGTEGAGEEEEEAAISSLVRMSWTGNEGLFPVCLQEMEAGGRQVAGWVSQHRHLGSDPAVTDSHPIYLALGIGSEGLGIRGRQELWQCCWENRTDLEET